MSALNGLEVLIRCFLFSVSYSAVAAAFASGCVAEDTTAMSAFNLLHLVTKSQPVALRACGLPSGC